MTQRRNTPALILGIILAITIIIAMALPLWTVYQASVSSYYSLNEKTLVFNTYSIPTSGNHFNDEYKWICGFVGFLIFVLFVSAALAVAGGIVVYLGKRNLRGLGIVGGLMSSIIFFILMIIGFVAASTYTFAGSTSSAGVGWGEFPFLLVLGVAIPFMVMLKSHSYYDATKPVTSSSSTNVSAQPQANEPTFVENKDDEYRVYSNLEGAQRILDVYEDRVALTQLQNFRAYMTNDFFKGKKEIPFSSMTSIQFKEASSVILGYIQFEVAGNTNENNFTSENSWTFEKDKNVIAEEVYEYCRAQILRYKEQKNNVISHANSEKPKTDSFSKADEIKKFKELLDQGAITQEEFNEEKKKILNK